MIDEEEYEQKYYHIFEKPGNHKVTFLFKKDLLSLDKIFQNINNLIEADFSKLNLKEVESASHSFYDNNNIIKINFENETPKLKNLSSIFSECYSLQSINLNIDTSKVTNIIRKCI